MVTLAQMRKQLCVGVLMLQARPACYAVSSTEHGPGLKSANRLSMGESGLNTKQSRLPWEIHPSRIAISRLPNKQAHKLGSGMLVHWSHL